ncbi:MAG: hypothetical protein JNM27_22705 [Leptospirales bacterium]|nr:hypothetical protein [Leptospirales bacterium]
MLRRLIYLAVFLLSSSLSAEDLDGTLSYFKDYDFSGKTRIIELDGNAVVARATLHYYSKPAGVHDGDGGTMFHLKVINPAAITEGTYVLNQSIFQARVAKWASPHGYDVMTSLSGTIRVHKYEKFRKLVADVSIKYGPEGETYSGRIVFNNHDMSRKLNRKIDWQIYDQRSFRARTQIQSGDLVGTWKGVDRIWESSGTFYGMLDPSIDPNESLEVKGDAMRRAASGAWEKFILRENLIHVTAAPNENDRRITGTINLITADALTVTWVLKWKYEGNEFSSTQRVIYKRKP